MGRLKNNQAKQHFAYKNDEHDLVMLGQFLRDTTKYRVEREWYIAFDRLTGYYKGFTKTVPNNMKYKVRNPDLILIDKESNKLVLIIELDGEVHDVHFFDTQQRNEEYFHAGLPFITLQPSEIKTNIFDLVTKKMGERLGAKN